MDMIEITNIKHSQQASRELRREAELTRMMRAADRPAARPVVAEEVVIRLANFADEAALRHLAEIDGHDVPSRSLVAEIHGELLAALPLDGGPAAANPFRPTAELVEMLKLRAAQLRGEPIGGGRLRRAWATVRGATSRPVMAPLAGEVSLPARHDGE